MTLVQQLNALVDKLAALFKAQQAAQPLKNFQSGSIPVGGLPGYPTDGNTGNATSYWIEFPVAYSSKPMVFIEQERTMNGTYFCTKWNANDEEACKGFWVRTNYSSAAMGVQWFAFSAE
ncbi:hypothetical protein [Neisseria perflava]|uniref:hypothetical protein n=1 Tax=Neisseria perflava TaxID=33053 RepID=UPI00209CA4D2|nr:hypothetical protein [Neisseria perflava]MCP1659355.1 hypothetical protein [Neisseria perflava]MCP1772840.1 hypothetical protein [Neisseria perflava]